MHTLWLSRDEVAAYGRDFLTRVLAEGSPRPEIWCAITVSGMELAVVLTELMNEMEPGYAEGVDFWTVGRERGSDKIVRFGVEETVSEDFSALAGKRVVILDSAVHSGETFSRVHQRVASAKPLSVVTFSLVVKKSSAFYPTFWSCSVEDADRVYFLLDAIPNNRLTTGSKNKDRGMSWNMRRMNASDCERPLVTSGLNSIDRITWHERFYAMETNEHGLATYLCEIGPDIAGFVTFHLGTKGTLVIDEVAVDRGFQDRGLGGVLLRFAETLARQFSSHAIRFWAVADKIEWYKKHGYSSIHDEPQVKCGDEQFQPMEKKGLYRTFFRHSE